MMELDFNFMLRKKVLDNLKSSLTLWHLCIQEPFVNIPEDTIREALKVVLGMV